MQRWAPIALSLLVLAAGTGCDAPPGTSAAPSAPGATAALAADYSTVDNQYRQIQVGLNLPTGVTFPEHLPKTSDHYAPGSGVITAQNYWLCAWLWTYLDGAPSSEGQSKEAVQQLPKYRRMDAYTKGLDAQGRNAVDVAIQGAHKGVKTTVIAFAQTTCGGPFYGRAHPGAGDH